MCKTILAEHIDKESLAITKGNIKLPLFHATFNCTCWIEIWVLVCPKHSNKGLKVQACGLESTIGICAVKSWSFCCVKDVSVMMDHIVKPYVVVLQCNTLSTIVTLGLMDSGLGRNV